MENEHDASWGVQRHRMLTQCPRRAPRFVSACPPWRSTFLHQVDPLPFEVGDATVRHVLTPSTPDLLRSEAARALRTPLPQTTARGLPFVARIWSGTPSRSC